MVDSLWQCAPTATNMEIINAIRQSANQSANPDSLTGYGIPNFPAACMLLSGLNPELLNTGDQLQILGNPFSDKISFRFITNKNQKIEIYVSDLAGRLIFTNSRFVYAMNSNDIQIPANFSKGIYTLSVTTQSSRYSEKILIK
jgi:hypothetical protein